MKGIIGKTFERGRSVFCRLQPAGRLAGLLVIGVLTTAPAPSFGAFAAVEGPAESGKSNIPDQTALYGKPVREIRIIGARHTKEYIIRRELQSRVGEPYGVDDIKVDRERLDRLGVFSSVDVYALAEEDGVVLIVDVEETFRFLPSLSIAITDENGILIGAGLKSVNLFGKAKFLSVGARFGGATTIECMYRDPWIAGERVALDARYFHLDRRNKIFDYHEISDEAFLEIKAYAGESGRIGGRVRLEAMKSDVPGITLSPDGRDITASLEAFVGYDTRDRWTNPGRGWWNEIALVRGGAFGSDYDFWRLHLDIRRFHPVYGRHSLGFFSLTTLTTGTAGENFAVWQQYGLGGTTTIRGWELASEIGKNQFINSLEYRYTVLEPRAIRIFGLSLSLGLQTVVFGDLGSAWTGREEFEDSFIGGYGAGLRLLIPYIGVARIEFGLGQPGKGVIFHLGGREKAERQRERVR